MHRFDSKITSDFIESINVSQFRGIKNLVLDECNLINVIVGKNNVGKTSILESIKFALTENFQDVISVLSIRERRGLPDFLDLFESIFPFGSNQISTSYVKNNIKTKVNLTFETDVNPLNADLRLTGVENPRTREYLENVIRINHLEGKKIKQYRAVLKVNDIESVEYFDEIDPEIGVSVIRANEKVKYVSPCSHLEIDVHDLTPVLMDLKAHEILKRLLNMFDPSIKDIITLPLKGYTYNQRLGIYVLKSNCNEPVPLNSFGDGLKKALQIACCILSGDVKVLLIDEIETSLHHLFFEDVFLFMAKMAKSRGVQVFLTTHSKETISALADICSINSICGNCVTLYSIRRDVDATHSRRVDSEQLSEMTLYGSEVRD